METENEGRDSSRGRVEPGRRSLTASEAAAIIGVIVTAVIRVLAVVFDVSLPEQRRLYRRRVAAETGAVPVIAAVTR